MSQKSSNSLVLSLLWVLLFVMQAFIPAQAGDTDYCVYTAHPYNADSYGWINIDNYYYKLYPDEDAFVGLEKGYISLQPSGAGFVDGGFLKLYVGGSVVTGVYSDISMSTSSRISNADGSIEISAGGGKVELWFYHFYTQDTTVSLKHNPHSGSIDYWYANWTLGVDCPPDNSAPPKVTSPSPYDGKVEVSRNVTLDWPSVSDPDGDSVGYIVYLGTDSTPDDGERVEITSLSNYTASNLNYSTRYFWRVDTSDGELITTGDVWEFTTEAQPNNPPPKATSPSPYDGQMGLARSVTLDWPTVTDPDGDSVSYKVYFGTDSSPDSGEFKTTTSLSSYSVSGLSYSTRYYWRIDTYDGQATTTGYVWDFVTESQPNTPPPKVTSPSPYDGQIGLARSVTLDWATVTDPDGDSVSYKIYFGTDSSPDSGEFKTTTSLSSYSVSGLSYSTRYYWRVDTYDGEVTTGGDVWDFVTEAQPNNPPPKAINPLPSDGSADISRSVTLDWPTVSDPDGDSVSYKVYFGTNSSLGSGEFKTTTSSSSYPAQELSYSTRYYWRVDTYDGEALTTGDIWSFTTAGAQEYIVTPVAGAGGSLSPSAAQSVVYGETLTFDVLPDPGYNIGVVTGCGGSLSSQDDLQGSTSSSIGVPTVGPPTVDPVTNIAFTTGAITSDCTVEASFVSDSYGLGVSVSGAGEGTVTSSPAGINCGTDCNESYSSGTYVTLTANASSGSTFAGWGGACSGTGSCNVSMTAAKSVTATFNADVVNYSLSVSKTGTGAGTVVSSPSGINCGTDCNESYSSGTYVMLTASPSNGSTFAGWSGACSGTGSCNISMTAAKSVTATFNVDVVNYNLSVSKSGTGSGTVTSSPSGINCGTDCDESYSSGTYVTLTASPSSGSTFAGWGDVCSGTGSCNVSMTAAKSVTASFNLASTDPSAWFDPASPQARINDTLSLGVQVDSQGMLVGAYQFEITFDPNYLQLDASVPVTAGTDGIDNPIVNPDNNSGTVVVSGFSINGVGPGSAMDFLTLNFQVTSLVGSTTVSLAIESLNAEDATVIGTVGSSVTVEITDLMCGDVNEDGSVSIVDALLIARNAAGLAASPFNPVAADVNDDSLGNIVDALLVARHAAGLEVASACLNALSGGTASRTVTRSTLPPANVRYLNADQAPKALVAKLREYGVDLDGIDHLIQSADGTRIVFEGLVDILGNDTNQLSDIYLFDVTMNSLELVSQGYYGVSGNGVSSYPAMDANGEKVVFQSHANDLVTGDEDGVSDIFLYDRISGAISRLTADAAYDSSHPTMDAQGSVIVFDQVDEYGYRQIVTHDEETQYQEVVSLSSNDAGQLLDNHHPAISSDARFMAYIETAAPGSEAETCSVHLYDVVESLYQRVECPVDYEEVEKPHAHFERDGQVILWGYLEESIAISTVNRLTQ